MAITRTALFFFIYLSGVCLHSQVNYNWAERLGTPAQDQINTMAVDNNGNVYVASTFSGSIDIDPGPGVMNLVSAGMNDIYIQKLNSAGNLVWACSIGGLLDETTRDLILDATGNILLSGTFQDTVDFDPGSSKFTLGTVSSTTLAAAFLLKLTNSGSFFSVGQHGGRSAILTCDNSGNILMSGIFSNLPACDVDPGLTTHTISSVTQYGGYVVKFDPSLNFIWAKAWSYNWNMDLAKIRTDPSGNVYVAGDFHGSLDFGPGPGTYTFTTTNFYNAGFLLKLDNSGSFLWARRLGDHSGNCEILGLDIDNSSNAYVTGPFSYPADLDPGPGILTYSFSSGSSFFIEKINPSGVMDWVKVIGTSFLSSSSHDLSLDANNNVYVTGSYSGVGDFDPGPNTFLLGWGWNDPVFILKLTSNGDFLHAASIGNGYAGAYNAGKVISVDPAQNIYVAGVCAGACDFDPGPTTATLAASVGWDGFVAKYCQAPGPLQIIGPAITCSSSNAYSVVPGSNTNYTWTLPSAYSSTISNNIVNTSNMFASGIITVAASNTCGATFNNTLAVTLTNSIQVNPGPAATICLNYYAYLQASGANSYQWSNGVSASSNLVAPLANTVYTVTGMAQGCPPSNATVAVFVDPAPPNLVLNSAAFCLGSSTVLTVSGGVSYLWDTGATTNTISVAPTNNTIYVVTGVGLACSTNTTATVTVYYPDDIHLGSSGDICAGKSSTLLAFGNPGTTHLWQTGSGSYSIVVTPSATTVYSIVSTSSVGCKSYNTVKVSVLPLPNTSVTPTQGTVCPGESILLTAKGASSYTWITGQTTKTVSVQPFVTTTYTVSGQNSAGCFKNAYSTIVVSECTGIEGINSTSRIYVFPNPNNGKFTLKNHSFTHISIVNMIGQTVKSIELRNNGAEQAIDISELAPGIYIMLAPDFTYKIIKSE